MLLALLAPSRFPRPAHMHSIVPTTRDTGRTVPTIEPQAAQDRCRSQPTSMPPCGSRCLHFGGLTLTEPTEHHDDDAAWELSLDDEDDPECSLVELLAVRITVHVEILDDEATDFRRATNGAASSVGRTLHRTMPCDAWRCRRRPDALHDKRIGDLLGDAMVEAASEADPGDPEFVAEYTDECGRAASRIMRAIVTHLEAEQRPSCRDP